jgi:hypothetical protein
VVSLTQTKEYNMATKIEQPAYVNHPLYIAVREARAAWWKLAQREDTPGVPYSAETEAARAVWVDAWNAWDAVR